LNQYYNRATTAALTSNKPKLPKAVQDEVNSHKNSSDSDQGSSHHGSAKKGHASSNVGSHAPVNKFLVRMTRKMQKFGAAHGESRKSSCGDDTSSAASHY
jgi:hypothetical protein